MKCNKCSIQVQKGWNYCPNCGARVGLLAKVNNFVSNILINNPGAKVKVRVVKKPGSIQLRQNPNLEIVEPETSTEKEGGFTKIIIKLPGITAPNQVQLKRIGASIELNAFTRTKRYFKILNLQNSRLIRRNFSNETLALFLNP